MKTSIQVQNLKCGGCVKTIRSKLGAIRGISEITVTPETHTVSFRAYSLNEALLAEEKLKALGYPPMKAENNMLSKAKAMVSCATGKLSK